LVCSQARVDFFLFLYHVVVHLDSAWPVVDPGDALHTGGKGRRRKLVVLVVLGLAPNTPGAPDTHDAIYKEAKAAARTAAESIKYAYRGSLGWSVSVATGSR
jgi:hypothetical protein